MTTTEIEYIQPKYSNEQDCLPDVSKSLIGSIVFYGNCLKSLDRKLITFYELMDYLVENKPKIPYARLLYGYYCVISFFPSEYLYVNNKHFTWYFQDDVLMMRMYCKMVKNLELNRDKDDDGVMLWEYLGDHVYDLKISDDINDILFCLLNVDRISKNKTLLFDYPWLMECIFLFRAENLYYYCDSGKDKVKKAQSIIENFIKSDQIEELANEEILQCIHLYCEYTLKIKMKCPLYFEHFKDVYCKILHHTPISKLEVMDISLIKNLLKITSNGYMYAYNVPDEYLRLSIYPIQCLSYILGFDILHEIPSYDQIQDALNDLVKLGPEVYVKSRLIAHNDERIVNDMDSVCENPDDYLPFDRYNLYCNKKIYQFTRPEFQKLIESKQNFYTHCELPLNAQLTIIHKNFYAKNLSLPECDTQLHLLEKAIAGELYKKSTTEKRTNDFSNIQGPIDQFPTQLLSNILFNMIPYSMNQE